MDYCNIPCQQTITQSAGRVISSFFLWFVRLVLLVYMQKKKKLMFYAMLKNDKLSKNNAKALSFSVSFAQFNHLGTPFTL